MGHTIKEANMTTAVIRATSVLVSREKKITHSSVGTIGRRGGAGRKSRRVAALCRARSQSLGEC